MAAPGPFFVASDPAMAGVRRILEKVRDSAASVLITGESGTGKSLVARVLHETGARRDGPFVEIACANLTDDLLENELFGHEKGAYSGATERRLGKFEIADGGTVLIDEVADCSLAIQGKLLRVLETREFERLGGTRAVRSDVRILSSSNADLEVLVGKGLFRQDLLYRLNVVRLHLPPLRERPRDLQELADHFLARLRRLYQRPRLRLDAGAREALRRHSWPGNVRELCAVLERAVLLAAGDTLRVADLPIPAPTAAGLVREAREHEWSLADLEAAYIREVLRGTRGNRSAAARILGINRKTLLEKRRRYGIE